MPHAKPNFDCPLISMVLGFSNPEDICGVIKLKDEHLMIESRNIIYIVNKSKCYEFVDKFLNDFIVIENIINKINDNSFQK